MRRLVRWMLVFVLVMFPLSGAGLAAPNDSLLLSELEVQVMPEMDKPEDWPPDTPVLLTGLYGSLENRTSQAFSDTIRFPIPKDPLTKIYLVAEFKDQNQPETPVDYKYDPQAGLLEWKPTAPIEPGKPYHFVVEYYSNPYQGKGSQREFPFKFQSYYDIKDLYFYVFEPLDGKNFKLSRETQETAKNNMGQTIHKLSKGFFSAKDEYLVTVSYQKDNFQTVMEKQEQTKAANPAPAGETKSPAGADESAGILFVALLLIALVGAGAYFWLRGNNKRVSPLGSRNRRDGELAQAVKALRKQLLEGSLTEEQYRKQLAKLANRV
ncbi:hypothetical protein [Effusibacillus lacus]|uniref:SHOCT domain-containing protein n=1 Tax=Effusibacillus lacus TaxID=1348429 RepID=A0A292YI01_9BACL|nr:hypothetical protein [Effusibacillus lacus]TCS70641.1 hypothetical protein EDD64_13130 [Effusibacillus lacus]GAX90637.1 hypothetical protein [Effusibacillus lacus]